MNKAESYSDNHRVKRVTVCGIDRIKANGFLSVRSTEVPRAYTRSVDGHGRLWDYSAPFMADIASNPGDMSNLASFPLIGNCVSKSHTVDGRKEAPECKTSKYNQLRTEAQFQRDERSHLPIRTDRCCDIIDGVHQICDRRVPEAINLLRSGGAIEQRGKFCVALLRAACVRVWAHFNSDSYLMLRNREHW